MNNQNPLSLVKILIVSTISLFDFSVKSDNHFPPKFGRYKFKEILRNELRGTTLGIYVYKNKKIIIKTFQKRIKNLDYLILKNEIAVSKILNQTRDRISSILPKELRRVKIPRILFVKESRNKLFVASEFINASPLRKASQKDQVKYYFRVVKFLKLLGENMTTKERSQISERDAKTIIRMYPLILLKSIFTHPSEAVNLLRGIFFFMKWSRLIHQLKISLAHKDLHLENILVSKKGIYIIDFEFTIFTPEVFEEFILLRHEWNKTILRGKLLKIIANKYKSYKNLQNLLRVVSLNVATHSLSANNFPQKLKRNYINLLSYSLKQSAFESFKN